MAAVGRWPFVGRTAETSRIRDLLTSHDAPGVVMSGPAGVGKTTLALTCLESAEQAGLTTARVTATQAASRLPFGAMAHLLPPLPTELRRPTHDRSELLRFTADALVDGAVGRRLVLFVDDAHLLDDMSAVLVHQLVSTRSATVLVVLRSGEPAPDPVTALWKDRLLDRVELGGLRSDLVDDVLRAALGGTVDPGVVDRLSDRCRGNMLFLRELVQGALEDGSLRDDGGIWRLVRDLHPSERLIELVEVRLRELEEPERAALEVVALGEPLGPAELEALADPGLVERLERRGVLASHREGRRLKIRLANPIYGDVLRAGIPGLRSRAIARALAEAVEATGARRQEDTLRIAVWRLDGGDARPELMLAAATMARWHYDFPLAERLARAAIAAGAGFDAAFLATQLAILQGRGDDAEADLAELAGTAATDAQRGLVAIARLDNVAFWHGRIEDGLRIAEEAESTIEDLDLRDEILARRSGILLGTKGPRAGADAAAPLLERTDGRALAWACLIASRSWVRQGRFTAALDVADRGRAADLALGHSFDWYPWLHVNFGCDALLHAGRIDEATAHATENYRQSLDDHSVEQQAFFAWELCKCALTRGHVRTAARYGREAAALFRDLGRPQLEYFCLPYLALAFALGGQAAEAGATLDALDRLGLPPTHYTGTDPLEARAWTAVAAGDLPRARVILEETAAVGDAVGDRVGAAVALHGLARLGHAREVSVRLSHLVAEIEGELSRLRLAHVDALVAGDPAGLESASAGFEAVGADLLAAEAAADAAAHWDRQGRRREATAAEHRAGLLAGRCEGALTPALQTTSRRAGLSASERDTATLAAVGHSNKEIAARLHISVRTVETYLQRAYGKLGVSRREQLAEALRPAPAPDRRTVSAPPDRAG